MKSMTILRVMLVLSSLSGAGMTTGCGQPPRKPESSDCARACRLVEAAKADISTRRYSKAIQKCEKAEYIDPSYVEAPYCILAANLGVLVQLLSDLVSLVAPQAGAPVYRYSSIRIGDPTSPLTNDIEGTLTNIDLYAYKLTKFDNPTFQIDDFSLDLDPSAVLRITHPGSDISVDDNVTINLRGTWDRTEIVALGASVNVFLGFWDYLWAHEIVIDNTQFGEGSAGIAQFIVSNPRLFVKAPNLAGRILGDEQHKGIKNDFLAALSYAVGRSSELERVSPATGGWVAAVKQSVANDAPDAVVKFTDADGDGIPEKIAIPALVELKAGIKGIEIESEFANPLSEKTWRAIIRAGEALRENIENGGESVSLQAALAGIADDVRADHPTNRLLAPNKAIPDFIALNPTKFLENPKYIRDLLPYYVTYMSNATTAVQYDLVIENEIYRAPATNQIEKVGRIFGNGIDFAHFSYPVSIEVGTGLFLSDFVMASILISADAITATTKVPQLFYIGLQDPSLGGLVELNSDWLNNNGSTAAFSAADNFSFNQNLNRLIKFYCLNTTLKNDKGDVDIVGILDNEHAAYASNAIGDCE